MRQRNIPQPHKPPEQQPQQQDGFVERIVQPGEYQDATEAIRDAQHALQQRRQENALRLEQLRLQVQAGIDDLESGDFVEIADADLDAYIEGLGGVEGNGSS